MNDGHYAVVTGASGYLGSRIASALEENGWKVIRLVRSPSHGAAGERAFNLASPIGDDVRDDLARSALLVHAAYDLQATTASDIRRINIGGSRRLLDAAVEAGVGRVLVLSSMSAYHGTTQLYGQAKLEVEAMTHRAGGCALRPGLVYGVHAGGMAGALRKLAQLPITPLIGGDPRLFMVREDDLTTAVVALAGVETLPASLISVAHPEPVKLRTIMEAIAADASRTCRFITVPWRPAYAALRVAEAIGIRLRFRADSLLGLVYRAPHPTNVKLLQDLGITIRPFDVTHTETR